MKKSKKIFAGMTLIALALAAISTYVLLNRHSASAAASATIAAQGDSLPLFNTYALTSDSELYLMVPRSNFYVQLGTVANLNGGSLIGIDFRPADGKLYGLTDTGRLYTINVGVTPPRATLVSTLSPRFPSGLQSLLDFNPVVDAIRLIGSDTLNYAVVKNAQGILATTAVQTALTYAAGDVNAGRVPKVVGGSYTNNRAGAANTIFYAIDHDLDTFVTIADKNATGSSNTGGGRLQTIGRLRSSSGLNINVGPSTDIDITTDNNGVNRLVGISGKTMFMINLAQINPNLRLGTTQSVVVTAFNLAFVPKDGAIFDIAVVIPSTQVALR
jgi:Domain of unknown function (DUF4394)